MPSFNISRNSANCDETCIKCLFIVFFVLCLNNKNSTLRTITWSLDIYNKITQYIRNTRSV